MHDSVVSFLLHLDGKRQDVVAISQNILKHAWISEGVSQSIFKIWYNNIIVLKVTYATSVWLTKLQKIHGIKRLTTIQYIMLLVISRDYRKNSNAALFVLTGILPLGIRLQQISTMGRVLRLGSPVDEHLPFMYRRKSGSSQIKP